MTGQHQHSLPRAAGLLLHPTSLPGPHGVGDLGAGVYRFIEFLAAARQTLWQVMPLGPVGMGNSPYAARSAFAGDPLLIALDQLAGQGWAEWADLDGPSFPTDRVEYGAATDLKLAVLGRAFERFDAVAPAEDRADFEGYREQERGWLDDYALFMALREAHGGRGWWDWAPGLALREPDALAMAGRDLAERIRFHQFGQWVFARQWASARRYANARGIRVVGDIPIFVAHDSVDVWAHRELFYLDAEGRPTVVAGVPPDYFSPTGQRWGNPLYDWARMAEDGYRWWIARFRATLGQFDVIRLDHFRGFQAYWEVPAEHDTALHGRWVAGPRVALFGAVAAALGRVPMIVEDLGEITPDVIELRERLGFPGLKVLQFAFAEDARGVPTGRNAYLPHNYEANAVVYTGTHDNDTTAGWFSALGDAERAAVLRYLGTDGRDAASDLIRLAHASVARWAIVPLQDVLGLGSEARMNVPGRPDGNWAWRFAAGDLTPEHAARLADLTATYGRWPGVVGDR